MRIHYITIHYIHVNAKVNVARKFEIFPLEAERFQFLNTSSNLINKRNAVKKAAERLCIIR